MSARQIVIDASIALKWRLRDEVETASADRLLDDYLNGSLHLIIPTLFDYEITNALRSAVLRNRLTEAEALIALDYYRELTIERREFSEFQERTLQLACQHQRFAYDGAYNALAASLNIWFYTGDIRLYNAVSGVLTWVKWIGDYQLEAIPESI